MRWIITHDLTEAREGAAYRFGHSGVPQRLSRDDLIVLAAGLAYEFRLIDGEGYACYLGRCDPIDATAPAAAYALLDWGARQARCTVLDFRQRGKTRWAGRLTLPGVEAGR